MKTQTIVTTGMVACGILILIQIAQAEKNEVDAVAKKTSDISHLSTAIEYNYGTPVLGFAMALHVENEKIKQGFPIWVTIRIKNVSDKTLKIIETNPRKQFAFVIFDAEQKEVPKSRYQLNLEKVFFNTRFLMSDIKPGEYQTYRFNIGCRFDLTIPGTYTVQSIFQVNDPSKNETHRIYTKDVLTKKEIFTITQFVDGIRVPDDKDENPTMEKEPAK